MVENNPFKINEPAGSSDIDLEDTLLSPELYELDWDEEEELGDAEFERILSGRSKYGLVERKTLWSWCMRLIQCTLLLVVVAGTVIVVYKLLQPSAQPQSIKYPNHVEHRHHVSVYHSQHFAKHKALMKVHEKGKRKINPEVLKKIHARIKSNIGLRLKEKLSQWKNRQLSREEKMGTTPKSLLGFWNHSSPGEVPQPMLSATQRDVRDKSNPLRSLGRNPHMAKILTDVSGSRVNPQLGLNPRLNAKTSGDTTAQLRETEGNKKNRYSRISAVKESPPAQGYNHRPPGTSSMSKRNPEPSSSGRNQVLPPISHETSPKRAGRKKARAPKNHISNQKRPKRNK